MDERDRTNSGEGEDAADQRAFDRFMAGQAVPPKLEGEPVSGGAHLGKAADTSSSQAVTGAESNSGVSSARSQHRHHSHSHSHGSHRWWDFPLNVAGKRLAAGAIVALLIALVGAVVMWPSGSNEVPDVLTSVGIERRTANVLSVDQIECLGAPTSEIRCDTVTFELDDGDTGTYLQTLTPFTDPVEVGDKIVVADQLGLDVGDEFRYYFLDYHRTFPLLLLAGIFALAVVALGRIQGLRSLVALVASFVILAIFTLPALLETNAPVLVAIVGSAGVATVTFFLTHGVNHLSTVSLLGSLSSLSLTGLLAWIFVGATHLTGLSSEDSLFLIAGNADINIQGILLAGMIIGTVGVLDDVTITQSAAVAEIHAADATMSRRRLYQSALRIGRDHIGSTTNTLVFAYAGAALPFLMLLTQAEVELTDALTSEAIAIEIVRSLVGGIGLIASVPITTALAVWVVRQGSAAAPDDSLA